MVSSLEKTRKRKTKQSTVELESMADTSQDGEKRKRGPGRPPKNSSKNFTTEEGTEVITVYKFLHLVYLIQTVDVGDECFIYRSQ